MKSRQRINDSIVQYLLTLLQAFYAKIQRQAMVPVPYKSLSIPLQAPPSMGRQAPDAAILLLDAVDQVGGEGMPEAVVLLLSGHPYLLFTTSLSNEGFLRYTSRYTRVHF